MFCADGLKVGALKGRGSTLAVQGLVFHFTISTGTSEAEATNFHVDMPDRHFVDIWRRWNRYARRCAQVRSSDPDSKSVIIGDEGMQSGHKGMSGVRRE